MSDINLNEDQTYEPSLSLAQLAEEYSALANGFKYTTTKFGKDTTKSQKWIKPMGLWMWLKLAKDRGYRYMRVVFHGSSQEGYNSMRNDPIGPSLEHAGANAEAHGKGTYFSLSDHATVSYNNASGKKAGTCIVGLFLTHERIAWSHRTRGNKHGAVTMVEDEPPNPVYKTFNLNTPKPGIHNCVVVHEPALVLTVGYAEAV